MSWRKEGRMTVYEAYNRLFEIYLELAESKYNPENPYENLEECIKACKRYLNKLFGMVELMKAMGEIDSEMADRETHRIIEAFSTMRICNAYMTDGEVMVYVKQE